MNDSQHPLASALAKNKDLYDVLARHGVTEADLVRAFDDLRLRGLESDDLLTLVTHAARMTRASRRAG